MEGYKERKEHPYSIRIIDGLSFYEIATSYFYTALTPFLKLTHIQKFHSTSSDNDIG